jgi:DNA-directed RNA polymerase specialized sigma subunit
MRPNELIEILIEADGPVCVRILIESSVHLPNRSSRWVASFRDENGQPVWKSTGARDKKTAMAMAKEWEQEAKRKRAAQGAVPRKPTIRVRAGSGEREAGLLSQQEVAAVLRISVRAVRAIEQRAFYKLRCHRTRGGVT